MEIIYVLVPLSIMICGVAIAFFHWAVNNGQFDDLDTPAWTILRDEKPCTTRPDDND